VRGNRRSSQEISEKGTPKKKSMKVMSKAMEEEKREGGGEKNDGKRFWASIQERKWAGERDQKRRIATGEISEREGLPTEKRQKKISHGEVHPLV